ncbi:hypothetical protein RhiirA1_465582 [Rhizophagus irregularis]|uniref:Uncharacterized protein n=1 Tax=Rhizophagus irregularis TaxID=588596 RepID=A0A2N0RFQ8_9GLOM|nr:hypothetical protein RhiirA1_465582 [Rhizophagus irregularis]
MPFLSILTKYIVKTEEKVNKSNLKTFCKSNEEERMVIFALLRSKETDTNVVSSLIPIVDTISSQQSSKPSFLRLQTKLYSKRET